MILATSAGSGGRPVSAKLNRRASTCRLAWFAGCSCSDSSRDSTKRSIGRADQDGSLTVGTLGERIGTPRDAVQEGRQIATIRTKELGISVPIALMTPHTRRGPS